MIIVDLVVHIIRRPFEDRGPFKCRRIEDEAVVSNFGNSILEFPNVLEFLPPLDGVAAGPIPVDPASTSRMSGSSADAVHMTSNIIPKLVSEKFKEGAARLHHELKLVSLEDHAWYLKTWDEGEVGILKLHCIECSKDFGSWVWDHNTATVTNLFFNFKKSYINSTRHFKSYYCRRSEIFENHPTSMAPTGKTIQMTHKDHRRAVQLGLDIMEIVNANTFSKTKPFAVVGDANDDLVKSFWMKVRCTYCDEYFALYPPNKTLEINLVVQSMRSLFLTLTARMTPILPSD
jgi:hypothetical protein